jgi:hypothetical protein
LGQAAEKQSSFGLKAGERKGNYRCFMKAYLLMSDSNSIQRGTEDENYN